jgi:hypothetical protein
MDSDTTTPVEKTGISRRAVIVGGATGAAAFWSVPVIDSITQRAAAASGCVNGQTYAVSYIFVGFTFGGGTYFAGTTGGSCAFTQGTYMNGLATGQFLWTPAGCGVSGHFYGIQTFNGTPSSGDVVYNTTASVVGDSPATYVPGSSIGTYLTCNGSQITPKPGVVIEAIFYYVGGGSNHAHAVCADSSGNPVCQIAD